MCTMSYNCNVLPRNNFVYCIEENTPNGRPKRWNARFYQTGQSAYYIGLGYTCSRCRTYADWHRCRLKRRMRAYSWKALYSLRRHGSVDGHYSLAVREQLHWPLYSVVSWHAPDRRHSSRA